jgi:ComF family protein
LLSDLQPLLNWFLPPTCVLCGAAAHRNMDLCLGCESDFPFIVGTVPTYALCRYEFPMDYLITQIKFHGQLVYAKVLGELLAEKLPEIQAEVLIPVPLHPTRLRERGYNQALELARPLAKKRKIPLDIFSCTRIRSTQPQMAMSATKRAENLKDAFTVNPNFKTKHVAIIDDVVTTGHTVDELSRVLYQQGVEKIDVICCARTVLSS